jgi:hypothetical protein
MAEQQHLMAQAKPLLPRGFLQTRTCQWQQQRSWLATRGATLHPLTPHDATVRSGKKKRGVMKRWKGALVSSRTNSVLTNVKAMTKGQWSLGTCEGDA